MSTINASATHLDAKRLAAKGAVRATVLGRRAIVFAQAWDPATPNPDMPPYTITARAIVSGGQDIEAQGTPDADSETQQLIDQLTWEAWPS